MILASCSLNLKRKNHLLHDVMEMLMNKQDAQKINDHIEGMIHHATHVLFIAKNSGVKKQSCEYKKCLGP